MQVRESLQKMGVAPYELAYYEGKIRDGSMSLLSIERDHQKKQRLLQKSQQKKRKINGETSRAHRDRESCEESD